MTGCCLESEPPAEDRSWCLFHATVQVAALNAGQKDYIAFDDLFKMWVDMLMGIIPRTPDMRRVYNSATSTEDQGFLQNLALFTPALSKVQPPSPLHADP